MARGLWDDMTSKYGFNDGETTEERDYQARDNLCKLLNAREEMKAAGVRAIPFDRPGVHNGCLIILLPDTPNLTNEEMEQQWHDGKIQPVELPDDLEVDELVNAAYDALE